MGVAIGIHGNRNTKVISLHVLVHGMPYLHVVALNVYSYGSK